MTSKKLVVALLGLVAIVIGAYQVGRGLGYFHTHGPMQVVSAVTSRGYSDLTAIDPTSTLKPTDTTIHLVVAIRDSVADTPITVTWWAVAAGELNEQQIYQTSGKLPAGDTTLNFTLVGSKPWPAGRYRADLQVSGKLDRSVPFTIAP